MIAPSSDPNLERGGLFRVFHFRSPIASDCRAALGASRRGRWPGSLGWLWGWPPGLGRQGLREHDAGERVYAHLLINQNSAKRPSWPLKRKHDGWTLQELIDAGMSATAGCLDCRRHARLPAVRDRFGPEHQSGPNQLSLESRLKFVRTRRPAGLSAATMDSFRAPPLRKDGLRPDRTSGQNLSADRKITNCAAAMPSAKASAFSLTASIASIPFGARLLASKAISGRRMATTAGVNIRSPQSENALWVWRFLRVDIVPPSGPGCSANTHQSGVCSWRMAAFMSPS